jgi:hypothetical protein
VLWTDPPPCHLNILPFTTARGAVRKDPIFDLLIRGKFACLVHELPLYLARKSLLNDKPDLFAQAITLYGTRNHLGHGKTVSDPDRKLLPVDSEGAYSAVKIGVDVFAWYGERGYFLPNHSAVKF